MANKSLTEMNDQELMVTQKHGADALAFLEGNEFFVRTLKPFIDLEREQAKRDSDWVPGKTTDATECAMVNAFNSGKRHGLAAIEVQCQRIISRGMSAADEMSKRSRKKEKKDAL